MRKKKSSENTDVQEFVGKYEEKNPISRFLIREFYNALESLIPEDVSSIYEAGCGAGISSEYITGMPGMSKIRFEASDLRQDLVVLARQRLPSISFNVASIYDLPHSDQSVDLAIALETLEHPLFVNKDVAF